MYRIEKRDFGIKLTFGGVMSDRELITWLEESRPILAGMLEGFCVFVDMRTLGPLDKDGQKVMQLGQRTYKDHGMLRSVVILNNPVTTMQFKRIAMESGIYDWERYIDASRVPDWEQVGMDWLTRQIDPEQQTQPAAKR